MSDAGAIAAIVRDVVSANPDKVAAYRAGRTNLAGFFVGEVMKRTGGKENPGMVQALVKDTLA